jgi:hypothetical protein
MVLGVIVNRSNTKKTGEGYPAVFCFLSRHIAVALMPTLFDIRLIPANQGPGFWHHHVAT